MNLFRVLGLSLMSKLLSLSQRDSPKRRKILFATSHSSCLYEGHVIIKSLPTQPNLTLHFTLSHGQDCMVLEQPLFGQQQTPNSNESNHYHGFRLRGSSLQCEAAEHWRSWLWWEIICTKLISNPEVTKLDSCTWPSLTPTPASNAWLVGRIHSFHSIYSRKKLDPALPVKHCIITTFPQNTEKEMVGQSVCGLSSCGVSWTRGTSKPIGRLSMLNWWWSPLVRDITLIGFSVQRISAHEEKWTKKKAPWACHWSIHDFTHLREFLLIFGIHLFSSSICN